MLETMHISHIKILLYFFSIQKSNSFNLFDKRNCSIVLISLEFHG